jgi:hypothetical protein
MAIKYHCRCYSLLGCNRADLQVDTNVSVDAVAVICNSETEVLITTYKTKLCNNAEDHNQHLYRRENLKSETFM